MGISRIITLHDDILSNVVQCPDVVLQKVNTAFWIKYGHKSTINNHDCTGIHNSNKR